MAKAKKKAAKIKKKHWFEVIAPNTFGAVVLGETYVTEPEKMVGKIFTLNLRGFSSKSGRNNVSIGFEIKEVKENKARCIMLGYTLLPASVKRLAARGKEKISESFLIKTQDGQIARIKIILVTLNKTSNSTLTSIRNTLRKFIADKFVNLSYEELIELTIENKIQSEIKRSLSKVYPLRMAAIKSISIEKRRKKLKNVVEAVPSTEEKPKAESDEVPKAKEEIKTSVEEQSVKEEKVVEKKPKAEKKATTEKKPVKEEKVVEKKPKAEKKATTKKTKSKVEEGKEASTVEEDKKSSTVNEEEKVEKK